MNPPAGYLADVGDRRKGSRFRRSEAVRRLLLLAPPGAGKGTQGSRLREALEVEHLATGDILRAEVAGGSQAGDRAAGYLERGELVPDELILDLLAPALLAAAERGGYILDGFPRTVAQGEALEALTERHGIPLQKVIYLGVADDELTRRLLERAQEQGRSDDTPEVIARRLELFGTETRPLIEFYEQRGVLERVDGAGAVDDITAEILARLDAAGAGSSAAGRT
jgi:adenylate kinase